MNFNFFIIPDSTYVPAPNTPGIGQGSWQPGAITPAAFVPQIQKNGTSSTANNILSTFFADDIWAALQPAVDDENNIQTNQGGRTYYPDGMGPTNSMFQNLVPKGIPSTDVYMLVRDPTLRLQSAMSQFNLTDINAVIAALSSGATLSGMRLPINQDPHFMPQMNWIDAANGQNIHLYIFPDHINDFCNDLGLGVMPQINASKLPKAQLAQAQTYAITSFYSDDANLFSSISMPGQLYVAG